MPSIWTFGPENCTGVDLSANAFWRLAMGASFAHNSPWLSLALIYPPGYGQTIAQTQIALARVGVPLAKDADEVQRVAAVMVTSGTQDTDLLRMTESFNLFKNNPKFKQDLLDISLRDATDLLNAYWKVRGWLLDGAKENQDVVVSSYVIKLRP
jgi:hypothetical protein